MKKIILILLLISTPALAGELVTDQIVRIEKGVISIQNEIAQLRLGYKTNKIIRNELQKRITKNDDAIYENKSNTVSLKDSLGLNSIIDQFQTKDIARNTRIIRKQINEIAALKQQVIELQADITKFMLR